MDFKFRQVEVFWAVMTTGTATSAASILNTSQPTISREIGLFEHATQMKLFERQSGKLVPTEHGLMLFEEVKDSFRGLDRIKNIAERIRFFSDAQLKITCLPAFSIALLPAVCKTFKVNYPEVSVSISAQESPALEESLSAQRYHLGFTEGGQIPLGTKANSLLELDMVCALPPNHPLSKKEIITPEDFENQDFVCLAAYDPYRIRVDSLFSALGIARKIIVETDSANAVCATVSLGGGVSIVNPLTALDYIDRGLVIRRFSKKITYSIQEVRPLHRPLAPQVEFFLQLLRDNCQLLILRLEGILKNQIMQTSE